ncbi:MAG TPA: glycosyl hydrolase [bacterium]|nr:glycosyl hydrolase [bacterium]
MNRKFSGVLWLAVLCLLGAVKPAPGSLETDWDNPPTNARLRAYWWWLNGNVTKESITHDLEEMKAKGFGGAVIFDADGASQGGNGKVPHGPVFFSPEWRELYKHTLREADRLGLEMSLNIQSGWNLGGPMVAAGDAPKKLVWSEILVTNGSSSIYLPPPKGRDGFYRDLFVLAWQMKPQTLAKSPVAQPKPLQNLRQKALLTALKPSSAPDSAPLFQELESTPGEEELWVADVMELTSKLNADGTLDWKAPGGVWRILRLGYTLNDHCRVSTCSDGWDGYALDPFDAGAFRRYWDAVVEPLIADAGPLAGKSLKYLHTDSWEVEVANWTPTLREEFRLRRGYDLLPWLPVITGSIVNSREESNRFLNDFRRTMGDLAIDNHYQLFKDGAHKHGLLIHPESGGPHAVPIDAQQCLGFNDVPMSEFWAWSWSHRIGDANRFFVKQPASAAHTCGHDLVMAEGFTTIGPHWQETIWDNLKPSFDQALCEGLNLLVWHAFVCSPKEQGIPGQQYFAGTHLNPNVTWWDKSKPFFDYINRCQAMLQQGLPCADVLYYYGDGVPNFTQLKASDPAHILPGYDYDVISRDALLARASVKAGQIVLPDGVSYRMLVLPEQEVIFLPVLKKIRDLVAAGATVIGPKPMKGETLRDYPAGDAEIAKLSRQLWDCQVASGRVIAGKNAREVLLADGVLPDCELLSPTSPQSSTNFDFIHRTAPGTEIYFVANRSTNAASATVAFRVSGKAPELWNAVTGQHQFALAYTEQNGRTLVPLDFGPCGSWFVVFREPAVAHPALAKTNGEKLSLLADISGAWTVAFDPNWGGPKSVQFDSLVDWTKRPEPGIKYYSGTAIYRKSFDLPADFKLGASRAFLDLGNVRELAEVKLNGKSCGITWSPPFRVDVTDAIRAGSNQLEVEVVNFWPNRLIGDAKLPPGERRTRTNITKFDKPKGDAHYTALMPSGLLGPVKLEVAEPSSR